MTNEKMQGLLTALKLATPKWAPQEINSILAQIWLKALEELDDENIKNAIVSAMKNCTEWPSPTEVKRIAQGSFQTDEEVGAEIVGRIIGAMSKYGYTNHNAAEAFIGPIGWEVVQMSGGWNEVTNQGYDDLVTCKKIWRDLAVQVSKKRFQTGANNPPALPETKERSDFLQKALNVASGNLDN